MKNFIKKKNLNAVKKKNETLTLNSHILLQQETQKLFMSSVIFVFTLSMRIAIEGCGHGCLDQIYKSIAKKQVELLIICGDFQSIRNQVDLKCMSVPDKYKRMGDFQDYFIGKKRAHTFTIFIGGNHEASNYLDELRYGGFVAPNIYYMGRSSVVWYKGLRIGGLSGVYWHKDFMHLNPSDYDFQNDRFAIRSVYHYRKDDYFKLRLLDQSNKMIMVSHDWPEGIYDYGNVENLLKNKPFFKNDIKNHCLGSPSNMELLKSIKPKYWFSAHLHVRFPATVDWNIISKKRELNEEENDTKRMKTENTEFTVVTDEIKLDLVGDCNNIEQNNQDTNNDEIELCLDDVDDVDKTKESNDNSVPIKQPNHDLKALLPTKFLALDKCLPRRNYLEVIDIEITDKNHISTKDKKKPLYRDVEYISSERVIQKHKQSLNSLNYNQLLNPPLEFLDELNTIKTLYIKEYENLNKEKYDSLFNIPLNSFVRTLSPNEKVHKKVQNPQTKFFETKFLDEQ
jgi:lariat debranching enzyme